MLRFVDLQEAYAAADKATGGWLPGGGTAGPLTDATRAVSESLPIIDMVSPASANYYRDKVEADRQRGERLAAEATEIGRSFRSGEREYSEQANQQIEDNRNEAALRGVVQSPWSGEMLSTRKEGQSDRDFYLQNRDFREAERPSRIAESVREDRETDYIIDRNREQFGTKQQREARHQSDKQGVGWINAVTEAKGMSTGEGPDAGRNGCVYAVNKVIKSAGLEVPWKDPATGEESVYIPFVTNWITSNGGKKVSAKEALPGDIVVALNGEHMGIVTDQVDGLGKPVVLSNSSSRASMTWEFPLVEGDDVYRVPQLQG